MSLFRWHIVSCSAWTLREGSPKPRNDVGRWMVVRGRLHRGVTEEAKLECEVFVDMEA
jgi:hypothetical protein